MAVYIKSILAGIAAFLVVIIISGMIVLAIMFRLPGLAAHIFPAHTFEIQYGTSYSPYFPLWQIFGLDGLAFVVVFARMLRRESARM